MQAFHYITTVATALIVFCLLAFHTKSLAAPFDRLIVFGDSMSDAGNDLDLLGFPMSPPYFEGRFTNGLAWSDHVAGGLGLPKLEPSRLGGTNYAYGGAQSGPGNSTVTLPLIVPNVGLQIDEFVATDGTLLETDLVALWIGFNDLSGSIPPSVTAANFHAHMQTLYDLGGRNFLVGDFAGHPNASTLNSLQRVRVRELRRQHPDANVVEFSLSSLISDIVNDPLQYGFTNLQDAACRDCGTGVGALRSDTDVVVNPDEYFFWDDIHPSAAVHLQVGERALNEVADTFEFVIGDCSSDGEISPIDLKCVATLRQRNEVVADLGTIVGDLDGDGFVALNDFLTLSENFGHDSEASYANGDIDLDGAVQFDDFLALSVNFGYSAQIAAVPEPSTLSSLALGAFLICWIRHRGRVSADGRGTYVRLN